MENKNIKIIALVAILVLLSGMMGFAIAGNPVSTNTYLLTGSMPRFADVAVDKFTNGTYFARDIASFNYTSSGTAAVTVINAAIDAVTSGGTVSIAPATYALTSSILMDNDNVTLSFQKGSLLTTANAMNAPAIYVTADNTEILNPTIDGNAVNQATPNPQGNYATYSVGVMILGDNNLVEGAYIYNERLIGIDVADGSHNSITKNRITNIGWNGINTSPGAENTVVTFNDVSASDDVGIADAGVNNEISTNYIHDLSGAATSGSGSTQWGIELMDEGSGSKAFGNRIINALIGISSTQNNSEIKENYIENTKRAIHINDNLEKITVSGNNIKNWDTTQGYDPAIKLDNAKDVEVSGNRLESSRSVAKGIYVYGGSVNSSLLENSFILALTGDTLAIYIDNGVGTKISQNIFTGQLGLAITADGLRTFVWDNHFVGTTDDVDDAGTTVYGNNFWKDASYDTTPPA